MKKILTLFLIIYLFSHLNAEKNFEKGFGLSAGITNGFGLSYRFIKQDYGLQFSLGAGGKKSSAVQSTGIQFVKPIHSVNKTRLNITGGIGTLFFLEDYKINNITYSTGIGPEIEVTFSGNMRFILSCPLTYFSNTNQDNIFVGFLPACSIIYYFE